MNDAELDDMRRRLQQLRSELQSIAGTGDAASDTVELDQSRVGRLSRMDALQAQAMSQAAGRRRMETLQQISKALQRIDDDDYGFCMDCGEEIAIRRLELNPAADRCISCAERREKQ